MANQYTNAWTVEDERYLEENIGTVTFNTIAKSLGKTTGAVITKAEKLGISNTKVACGLITINELSNILCVEWKVLKGWIDQYDLPAKRRNFREYKRNKRCFYYIDIEEFWKWASLNKDLINWFPLERQALPLEPEWVEERRKSDYYKWITRRRYWTPEEDSKLWSMYYDQGITQKEIANTLLRTERAIEKRLKRLRELRWNKKEVCL